MDDERRRYFEMFCGVAKQALEAPAAAHGRGIVTCGSLRFTPFLWFLVRSLRHHGCALPIELWHTEGEVNEELRRLLEPHGVMFRDADRSWSGGRSSMRRYAIKSYALVHSAFREVLFLDADNCVYRDPTFLFDTHEFHERRAVFWPDRHAQSGGDELRRDFGVTPGGIEFESGQIVIDRIDCWHELALTLHLNEHSHYYYRFFFGDKETFRLAFDYLRRPYALVPRAPIWDQQAPGFVQHWFDGQPLFHHRVSWEKWTIVPISMRGIDLPALPPEVVAALTAELRLRWARVMPLRERFRFRMKAAERWARERMKWRPR